MRALMKTAPLPGLTATTCADPTPGPHDAVIRVKATSLCGTDAHIYNWDPWAHSRIHPPRIIGHEMCGEVVEVGSAGKLVKIGDYVAAESHLTCGTCFQCRTGQAHVCRNYKILGVDRDGSFAEYIVLPENVLWQTSPSIAPEYASIQEPLGNAVDAALVEDVTGHTVLITGCGPTGLFAAAIARTAGAAVIIASDVSEYRLSLAKEVGADHGRRQYHRRVAGRRLVLVDSVQGRDDERRDRLPSRLPQITPHVARSVSAGYAASIASDRAAHGTGSTVDADLRGGQFLLPA